MNRFSRISNIFSKDLPSNFKCLTIAADDFTFRRRRFNSVNQNYGAKKRDETRKTFRHQPANPSTEAEAGI